MSLKRDLITFSPTHAANIAFKLALFTASFIALRVTKPKCPGNKAHGDASITNINKHFSGHMCLLPSY